MNSFNSLSLILLIVFFHSSTHSKVNSLTLDSLSSSDSLSDFDSNSADQLNCVGGYFLNFSPTVINASLGLFSLNARELLGFSYFSQQSSFVCLGQSGDSISLISRSLNGVEAFNGPFNSQPLDQNPALNFFFVAPKDNQYNLGQTSFLLRGNENQESELKSKSSIAIEPGFTRLIMFNLLQDVSIDSINLIFSDQPLEVERVNGLRSKKTENSFILSFPIPFGGSAMMDLPTSCDSLTGVFGSLNGENAISQAWPVRFSCDSITSRSVTLLIAYGNLYANVFLDQFQLNPTIKKSEAMPKPSAKNRPRKL